MKRNASIWEAIENTPQEAAAMRARADLMIALQERLTALKLTQAESAALLGVTQPRVSDLVRGKIDLFSMESLIDMLSRSGIEVEVRLRKAA
ncbi:MAG: helix-turn-helix domain-containing protein [Burkholderiales bacterium]